MGSQSKETRQQQQAQLAAQVEKRTALLTEQGKTAEQIARDAQLKNLKGNLKRTKLAIASIDKLAKTVAEARRAKNANAEKRAAAQPKKSKDKSGGAAGGEPDKKKKKEKKQQ